jgi:hypothetical protein
MNIDSELNKVNIARISRGANPFTKEEFISNLDLSWSLYLDGEVGDDDKQKILNFRDQEYDLAIEATPSWIKIVWLAIFIFAIYLVSRLF